MTCTFRELEDGEYFVQNENRVVVFKKGYFRGILGQIYNTRVSFISTKKHPYIPYGLGKLVIFNDNALVRKVKITVELI